jgi:hypothetical protein
MKRRPNKRMHLMKSVLVMGTTAFTGDPQRWADNGVRVPTDLTGNCRADERWKR